jgi:uncharacterized protein YjbI with pentapeptide repeats
VTPRSPATLELATVDANDLADDATHRRLGFYDLDLTARSAEGAEFDQCRFRNTDLGGTSLIRAQFTDCVFDSGNLANLRAERSSMLRTRLGVLRMTGVNWINGSLRDVTVAECRADLSSFRFSVLRNVVFDGCNLTRADFQNADVSGVQFVNCDLSAAQFSHATTSDTRFSNCVLAGIGGVTSLRGAIVEGADLISLGETLASALGIRITPGASS